MSVHWVECSELRVGGSLECRGEEKSHKDSLKLALIPTIFNLHTSFYIKRRKMGAGRRHVTMESNRLTVGSVSFKVTAVIANCCIDFHIN